MESNFIGQKTAMTYKVFFVEDEIVTREGIRDNVNWMINGFEYCGDASDGEMALPLLQTTKPDVLITDIKMPFMDGLQLCKIVRERMPLVKIIILSGHDEFVYAQKAIELGVTEYLLKPVTVQNLHHSLEKIAVQLDQERKEQKDLELLIEKVNESRDALRERLLLKLVVGAISSTDAIEQGQLLGLDLIARCYLVVILKAELEDRSEQFDYDEYRQVQEIVADRVRKNPDVFLLNKDWEELVLVMKGGTPEYLEEERDLLLGVIDQDVKRTRYHFAVGAGTPQKRIADIYHSFVEALATIQNATFANKPGANLAVDKEELLKIDKTAMENYLKSGVMDEIDEFFDRVIRPLGDSSLRSSLIKNYIVVDVIIAAAKFVKEWGGDIDRVVPELNSIETILVSIKTIENLKEQVCKILLSALAFRDTQTQPQHARLIQQAKNYIEKHYMEPDLSLNDITSTINLSPSHFSMIFSKETDQTFKDYLTTTRIQKAKELLRTTGLRSSDISYQVGYNDPHYFSFVFKKNTGFSPSKYRFQAQAKLKH
jgi:two-component system response regulator YesN